MKNSSLPISKPVLQTAFLIFILLPLVAVAKVDKYAGVGIVIDYEKGTRNIQIREVLYRSPADKAKIKRGLRLTAVDDLSVSGMSLVDVGNKIRGPVGTQVKLTLINPFNQVSRDFTVQRKEVKTRTDVWVPPPNWQPGPLNAGDLEEIKKVIARLDSDQKRKRMKELLHSLKNHKISKRQFFRSLKKEF